MKRVNVVIAERDREEHLVACLTSLDIANLSTEHQVNVYVVSDRISYAVKRVFSNIDVHYLICPTFDVVFNKSKLLNYGLELMQQQFDWVSIVDADMIYQLNFFHTIESLMTDYVYIVCDGNIEGNSQVSISNKALTLFRNIYGRNLFCEDFNGWGGEDSDLSFRARDLDRAGLINRLFIFNMWIHIEHEKHYTNKDANRKLFEKRRTENLETLRRWLNENTDSNLQVCTQFNHTG